MKNKKSMTTGIAQKSSTALFSLWWNVSKLYIKDNNIYIYIYIYIYKMYPQTRVSSFPGLISVAHVNE